MRTGKIKVALFSRSIYPRSGGSAFVTEQLSKNFAPEELVVIGGTHCLTAKCVNRPSEFPKFYYLRSQLNIGGRGERFFELVRWSLFPFVLLSALRIVMREKPNAIVATFPDSYFCWLALISARICDVPFFTYFHNTYAENRKGIKKLIALRAQREFFKQSRLIFVISDGLREYYEKMFPSIGRFRTFVHTTENLPEEQQITTRPNTSEEVQIAFTGNFNASNLEATIRLVNILKSMEGVKINFYTPVPKALLKLRGLDVDAIGFIGYLPKEQYRIALTDNDIMVLTHGFTGHYSSVEYETIFPTRTIELLLTGKPILAHVPEKSFVARFLKARKCAFVITEDRPEIVKNLVANFLKDRELHFELVRMAGVAAKMFHGPAVVSGVKEELKASIS